LVRTKFGLAKAKILPDIVYWLILAITAANYSFISHAYNSDLIIGGPLKPIAFLRLPLAVLGFLYLQAIYPKKLKYGPAGPVFILLLVMVVLSVPMSPNKMMALQYGTWFFFHLLFTAKYVQYLVDRLGYEQAKIKLAGPLMLFGLWFLMLTLLGLPNYQLGRPFPAVYSHYVSVVMIVPVFLGGLAICYRHLANKQLIKYALLFMGVFCLAVIAVSAKRASIVCALLIVGVYILFMLKASSKVFVIIFLPLALMFLLSGDIGEVADEATSFTQFKIEKGLDSRTSTSINARFYVWNLTMSLAIDNPLGVGVNVGRSLAGGGLHNTYLGYILEVGWVGALAIMTMIIVALYKGAIEGRKIAAKREMLFFITLPCMLYSVTEYNSSPGQPLFIPLWVGIFFLLLRVKPGKVQAPRQQTSREQNRTV